MKKTCIICGLEKDITEFYKHSRMNDGHLNKCKECCIAQAKERRILNIDKIRAYDRNRPNKKERLLKMKEYKSTMRKENPEKYDKIFHGIRKRYRAKYKEKCRAENLLNFAVKQGKIKRPDICALCKKQCKPQAHHYDYSKPLDVIWLCELCHAEEHNKIRELKRFLSKGDKIMKGKNVYEMFENGEFSLNIQEKLEAVYNECETKEEGYFKAGFLCHAIIDKAKRQLEQEMGQKAVS